jgi:hypothetical protein
MVMLLAALVAIPAMAQDRPSAATDPAGQWPPDGSFTYTLIPDSSGNVRAAIDRTVAGMFFIAQPIARGRLIKINPVPQHVRIRSGPDTISVAFDDGNPVVTPLSGDTVPWSNPLTHEMDRAHVALVRDTVKQTIAAPDGQRTNAFIFSEGGKRLRLVVTVTSHQLPRPLIYELLFRRDEAT